MTIDLPALLVHLIQLHLLFLGVLLAYAFVTNRLRKATQPLRERFAREAEKLLGERVLPEQDAEVLRFMLRNSFNGYLPWIFVVAIPFFAVLDRLGLAESPGRTWSRPSELRDRLVLTHSLWVISICAYSPLPGLVMLLWLLIITMIWMPIMATRSVAEVLAYVSHRSGNGRAAQAGG